MNLFRPDVARIDGYTPGEQPQDPGWVKLNTNENPYPPSPAVVESISAAARGPLNLYPDPLVRRFCTVVADLFDLDPDCVLPANGSDENLTIVMRSFVDSGQQVAFPYPSYTLYETLADLQGAQHQRLDLGDDWEWDARQAETVATTSKLVFVPNPNSPSGNCGSDELLLSLVPPRGVLVVDEAYGDFRDGPLSTDLLRSEQGSQIVLTRTLSKSYSLAGIRFGYALADPNLIAGMRKVKDSYNCNALSMAAATAALQDQAGMRSNVKRIQATRCRLVEALQRSGFHTVASQTNFVWATHPDGQHKQVFEQLKTRKI
ncbi:MAG: histidinol-phosphate transaminase, partial [Planctomycetaceae bacterium]